MRILVAVDHPYTQELLVSKLTAAGYPDISCALGETEIWNELHLDDSPVVAFLENETGIDLCQKLRRRERVHAPYVILLVEANQEQKIAAALKAGADDVLEKPLRPGMLRARLQVAERFLDQTDSNRRLRQEIDEWSKSDGTNPQLNALFELSAHAIVCANLKGEILNWNRGAEDTFGYSAAEAVGQTLALLCTTEQFKNMDELHELARNGTVVAAGTAKVQQKLGHQIDLEVTLTPVTDSTGSVVGTALLAHDVTEQKYIEAALAATDERYRSMVRLTNEALWRFELKQPCRITLPEEAQISHIYEHAVLVDCNDAMARMYGFVSAGDIIGAKLGDLFVETCRANVDGFRSLIRAGYGMTAFDAQEPDRDGHTRSFVYSMVGDLVDGEVRTLLGSQRDVSDLNRMEDQLRQSQKMEAVGHLATGVAHDFNNLLLAISGYTDLSLMSTRPGDSIHAKLLEIKKAATRAATLTRQLLVFSRNKVVQPKLLVVNDVVEDMNKLLARLFSADIEIQLSLDENLGPILADAGDVEQVLMNLAVNARDAMPNGGKLRISTHNQMLSQPLVTGLETVPPGNYVVLTISDTGSGMSLDTQKRIFEPFFSTKPARTGTGLGLSTSYAILHQNSGFILVYSELGKGTMFKLFFLRSNDRKPVEAPVERPFDGGPGRETVLLVEDEETVRDVVGEILELNGYNVLRACGGAAALSISEKYDQPIHLLVTDVVMPQMNGYLLAEKIAISHPDVKILFMSGYSDSAIVLQGKALEGSAFIQKPFASLAFVSKLREVLDQPVYSN